jgi:hypothetical protein
MFECCHNIISSAQTVSKPTRLIFFILLYLMSGQQNPDYILANQINLIYSTVIGQIMAEEYVYLVIGLSTSVKIWH